MLRNFNIFCCFHCVSNELIKYAQVVEGEDAAQLVGGWISSAYVDRLHVEVCLYLDYLKRLWLCLVGVWSDCVTVSFGLYLCPSFFIVINKSLLIWLEFS